MRSFLFFLLITFSLFSLILSQDKKQENKAEKKKNKKTEKKEEKSGIDAKNIKKENKTKSNKQKKSKNNKKHKKPKKTEEDKLVPPPFLSSISDIPDDTYNLPNDDVYLLNDKNIDKVLQKGNNYRWLVILFSETCGHCYYARTEIRKVLPEFKYSSYLRFAEIEINFNPMTNMRFNIQGVPYIFILQNNTMYIMDLYPSSKNIIKFLEMDLLYFLPEEKKPFPPPPKYNKFAMENIKNNFKDLTDNVNDYLKKYGINFEFTPLMLGIACVIGFIFMFLFECLCCAKFCPDEEEIKKEEKINEEKKEEKEISEKTEKDENKQKDKEISEEEKIKREKEKEIKQLEKENDRKDKKEDVNKNGKNKGIKDNKTNGKKKKE
jgi:flagellum-specific peptidoglycan hydrolase FlgJ